MIRNGRCRNAKNDLLRDASKRLRAISSSGVLRASTPQGSVR